MAEFNPDEFLNESNGFNPDEFIKEAEDKQKYDRPIEAALEGAARGASFGLSDIALTQSGFRTPEELKKIQEISPTISTGFELGGVIAPSLLSGGAGAIGSAARVVSAPVRGVTALGRMAENATAKSLASAAAQSTAKNILSKAAAKGVGSAIEGTFYGLGQVAHESALGETDDIAGSILANVGGTALLSGGIGAALPIVGFGIKSAIKATKPLISEIPEALSGLSKESQEILKDNAKFEKLKSLEQYGDNIDNVIINKSDELAHMADEASSSAFESSFKAMKDQEAKIGGLKADVDAVPLLKSIDDAIKRGGLDGRRVTPQAEKVYQDLVSIKRSIEDTITDNLGLEAGSIVPNEMKKITPSDALKMWRQYSDSANYASKLAESPYMNQVYKRLASTTDEAISALPDGGEWKAIKTDLKDVIQARKSLKNFGFNEGFGIDKEKFSRIAAINKDQNWIQVKKNLEKLDGKWGTNLADEFSQLRSYKEIYPKDALSRFQTGRAGLIPDLAAGGGAAVGALIGGPLGAAVGFGVGRGLGAIAQSPAFMRNLVRGSSIVSDALGSKLIAPVESAISKNMLMPNGMIPWASAKVTALATIERSNNSMNRKIDSGVNAFFKPSDDEDLEPADSMGAFSKTNFGKTRVVPIEDRQEAYLKRLDEITSIVSNPEMMSGLISKNLEQMALIAPMISQSLSQQISDSTAYLYNRLPKPVNADPVNPAKSDWKPADAQLSDAERLLQVYDNPMSVLKDLKNKKLTFQQVEDLRNLHPVIYRKIVEKAQDMATKSKGLTYSDRLYLSKLLGAPLSNDQSAAMFYSLQSNFQNQQPVRPSSGGRLQLNEKTANERVMSK